MAFAIRNDGLGWRAVNGSGDVGADETYSVTQPVPPAPTLLQVQSAQIAVINAACESVLAQITAPYPPSEIASWDQQLAEAQAWTASNSAPTPLLSAIIAANGATLSAQVASVLAKSAAFKAASGAAIGKRQLLTDQINAATTVAQVGAITW